MGANTVEYRQEYNKNKSKTIKLSNLIFPAEMSKIYVWGEKKMEKVWRQKLELCLLHKRRCLIIWCGRKSGQTIWSRIWGVIFFFFCGCSSGLKSWDDSPKEKKKIPWFIKMTEVNITPPGFIFFLLYYSADCTEHQGPLHRHTSLFHQKQSEPLMLGGKKKNGMWRTDCTLRLNWPMTRPVDQWRVTEDERRTDCFLLVAFEKMTRAELTII